MSAHLQLTRLEQHLQGWVGLEGLEHHLLLAHQWTELTRIFAVLYIQIWGGTDISCPWKLGKRTEWKYSRNNLVVKHHIWQRPSSVGCCHKIHSTSDTNQSWLAFFFHSPLTVENRRYGFPILSYCMWYTVNSTLVVSPSQVRPSVYLVDINDSYFEMAIVFFFFSLKHNCLALLKNVKL